MWNEMKEMQWKGREALSERGKVAKSKGGSGVHQLWQQLHCHQRNGNMQHGENHKDMDGMHE